ncbi:M23 family metallopeptidase [Agromyces aerolatus]|uniref:M23 family metallopeptidase n=1 Tax=Agromyces sp. LY-1074 TaxID=3074080 RepID=UPI0028555DD9|nr:MULTISPECIES: M23 family metallopeptidase [unclassified Agromyces]MDR5701384.1 M23 family metallopeptidase [Agromyces sp. LY-1074]MDR5706827.1 M23 family metallopeptidase [Agromyces sp. LY-1358]
MPESPLVPDGSTPGTPAPLPSEQPLTRRERREREAAAAALAATNQATEAPAEARPEPLAPTTAVMAVVESAQVSAEPASAAPAPEPAAIPEQVVMLEPTAAVSRRERRAGEVSGRRARATGDEASGRRAREADTDRARGAVADRGASASSSGALAAPAVTTRGGGRRAMRAVVAMGFAATLALATSVPALSLLTPSEVQAIALAAEDTATAKLNAPTQRVEVDGDVIASPTVEREGYQHQSIEEYARAAGIRAEATFTNNPSGTVQWPFAVGVHIGDQFGPRSCAGCSSDHGGQDFNPGLGAEIQAIADGVVSNSTDAGGSLGVVMMIDHVIDGETITSVYAHMQYDSRRFEKGDTVSVGDVVGTTGSTGMSTGPHLHFEIRLGGIDGKKVDPLEWLYANTN